jgi:DNA adenine methylase
VKGLEEYLAAPVAGGHVDEPGFFTQLRALRYVGSKIRLMGKLRPILKGMNAGFLVDVFGGSGAVTMGAGFSKRVFNDLDGDVVNFFRVLADPAQAQDLYRRLKRLPMSRQMFEELSAGYGEGGKSFEAMAPAERAAAFFYRSSFAFGGKIRSGGFAASVNEPTGVKEIRRYRGVLRSMSALREFWQGTVIEHQDFEEIIAGYGKRRDGLLFCDPPYFGKERYYTKDFTMADHARLAKALVAVPCGAVVTYYATPEIELLYPQPQWEHHLIEATKNSMKATAAKQKVHELVLVKRAEVARPVRGGGQMSLQF